MQYFDFIKPELLFLMPLLYSIGVFIKKSKVKDELIPFILLPISVTITVIYFAVISPPMTVTTFFAAATQGALISFGTVGTHQIFRQSKKYEEFVDVVDDIIAADKKATEIKNQMTNPNEQDDKQPK